MVVPVCLGLHHEHGDVLIKGQIVLLKRVVNRLRVSCDPRILDRFCLLSERINVLVGQILELSKGLFFRGLVQDEVLQEIKVFLRQAFVSQMSVFSENICRQIVMLVLAVQQDQVWECLSRERRVLEKEIELLKASRWLLLDVHEGGVMERNGIQLIFVSWRHIHEGFAGGSWILH